MLKKLKTIFLVSTIFGLTGCAANFSCTGKDTSAKGCEPVNSVYHSMDDRFYDYREDNIRKHNNNKKEFVKINISKASNIIKYPKAGNPVLSKPIVSRILFTDFIDDQNDFNEGGYTYIKLQDSKWLTKD